MDENDRKLNARYQYREKQKLRRACKGFRESDEDQNTYVDQNPISILQTLEDLKEYRQKESRSDDDFYQLNLGYEKSEYDSKKIKR